MAQFDGKIFCIGFYKTGTTSLYEALRLLGYRTLDLAGSGSVHQIDAAAGSVGMRVPAVFKVAKLGRGGFGR